MRYSIHQYKWNYVYVTCWKVFGKSECSVWPSVGRDKSGPYGDSWGVVRMAAWYGGRGMVTLPLVIV